VTPPHGDLEARLSATDLASETVWCSAAEEDRMPCSIRRLMRGLCCVKKALGDYHEALNLFAVIGRTINTCR